MTAQLDFVQDVLSGLNVREYNYLSFEQADAPLVGLKHLQHGRTEGGYPWDDFVPEYCWIVGVWDDGLDYDMDGNAYFDDYPGEHAASYHRTQKGAEQAAAWLEHYGIEARRINVHQGYQVLYDYNMPLED